MSGFIDACSRGDLQAGITFLRDHSVSQERKQAAFEAACSNGHEDVAKWLHFNIGGVSLLGAPYVKARAGGHVALADWLFKAQRV
jgi:urocanate hydratase